MIPILLAILFFTLTAIILCMAAHSDWKGMVIPNEYSLALVGLFVLGSVIPASLFPGIHLVGGLIAGLIVLLLMLFFYVMGAMGGGDTKLAASVALLVGFSQLGIFVMIMAFSGGILGIYAIATRRYGDTILPKNPPENSWLAQLKQGANKIPYGIAISLGAGCALFDKWLMPVINGF